MRVTALLMKDKGDIGFMFKQGLIRITPSIKKSKNGLVNIIVM